MANAEKTAAVAEIAESFRGANAALLTEYRGLSVSEITELRRALGAGAQYAVVKNTLTKIAAQEAGVPGIDELLAGPTAIAFVSGDPVEAAKGLRDFAKTHPMLVVKGGVLDGKPLSPAEIAQLADLESREVLLAKLAGALQASLSQAVGLFAAPLSQAARVLGAYEAQRQSEAPAGGDETPQEVVADAAAPQPGAAPEEGPGRPDAEPAAPVEAVADAPDPTEAVADAVAPQPDPSADGSTD
ncbi:MAG: 50S ribosomal protein L10 [Mycobacteriales bacterium]